MCEFFLQNWDSNFKGNFVGSYNSLIVAFQKMMTTQYDV